MKQKEVHDSRYINSRYLTDRSFAGLWISSQDSTVCSHTGNQTRQCTTGNAAQQLYRKLKSKALFLGEQCIHCTPTTEQF